MMKNKKGFTLIELLVVIAIIGVLAGAILIAINPKEKIDKAKKSTLKNDLSSIITPIQMKYEDDDYSYAGICTYKAYLAFKTKYNTSDETDDAACEYVAAKPAANPPTPEMWAISAIDKSGNKVCIDSTDQTVVTGKVAKDTGVCGAPS